MLLGSFCTGIGGLDLAVETVFGAEPAWFAEIDADASTVLAHRFPDVPNIGSLIRDSYDDLPAVDVLVAGYPCQPFSLAGRRQGADDARHLWPHIAHAIRVLRPRLVCLENVAGHLTLGFDKVLGDLHTLRFDAEWGTFRASDVGAPHRRERLFILARNTESITRNRLGETETVEHRTRTRSTNSAPPSNPDIAGSGRNSGPETSPDRESTRLEGTFRMEEPGRQRPFRRADADTDSVRRERREEPSVNPPGTFEPPRRHDTARRDADRRPDMGRYETAVRRWEHIHGPAPHPLDNKRRLNPQFVEWMMGFPDGWCTDLVKRSAALRLCGNAVVPQAAAAAFSALADRLRDEVA